MFQKLSRIAFIIYLVSLSFLSLNKFNSDASLNNFTVITIRGDYFFHFIAYLPIFLLGKFALKWSSLKVLFLALFIASLLEYLQYLIPYRTFNVNDLLANNLGVLLSFTIYKLMCISKIIKI